MGGLCMGGMCMGGMCVFSSRVCGGDRGKQTVYCHRERERGRRKREGGEEGKKRTSSREKKREVRK